MNIIIKDSSSIKIYKDEVINFTINNFDSYLFMDNGYGRKFFSTANSDINFNKTLYGLREKVFNELGIKNYLEEPLFGIFIGVNTFGGNVHEHTDPAPENYNHLRVNFLLSKPYKGGNPIIDGQTYMIGEGEGWFNIASLWQHSSEPVQGEKPRIVLSLGCLIKDQDLFKIKSLEFK